MRAHPVAFVMGLVFGFVLSQAPEFAQQYRQRLGGAVDELQRIIQQFDEDSRRSGYDRTAALRLMANNNEPIFPGAIAWKAEAHIAGKTLPPTDIQASMMSNISEST